MEYVDHHFRVDLAQKFGIDAAVFLHDVYFWVSYNKSNQKNYRDGRYWTYNKMTAFCERHPYWSRRQIERIIASCKEHGLLLIGCYNTDTRDRTKWYSLSDKAMRFFCDDASYGGGEMLAPKASEDARNEPPDLADSNAPNGEMESTEYGNGIHQTVTALPDNILADSFIASPIVPPEGDKPRRAKRKRSEPKVVPDWKTERFEAFWQAYPCGKSKQAAIKAWDKLRPDDALLEQMARGLKRAMQSRQWQEGIGIPYASTWLNGRRWEDEEDKSVGSAAPAPVAPRKFHMEVIDGEEVVVYDD